MIPMVSIFFGALLIPRQAISLGPEAGGQYRHQDPTLTSSTVNLNKVPGESPAYYCSDPIDDIFQINRLDFVPTNVRIGFYQNVRFIGKFTSPTGANPWLNVTGSINGRQERSPLYNAPLCDIDVFQELSIPTPTPGADPSSWGGRDEPRLHRACPPEITVGYAVVSSPPMPLTPLTVPEGKYDLRAEAMTQDGKRIFCVQGSFDVTN